MAKKKAPKFPTAIFITREDNGDGSSYLLEHETLDSIEHGTKVAIYHLSEVLRVDVERSLVKE